VAWAAAWPAPYVVVDTHPGANVAADDARDVAGLIVTPVVLGMRELDSLEGMLGELEGTGARVLLVPTMIPASPPAALVARLGTLAARARAPVAPPVSEHRFLRRRRLRTALVAERTPGARVRVAAAELRAVADAVEAHCG
jgi:cellulose biosynthesis protein BcsQ